jgi:hypothetical protein
MRIYRRDAALSAIPPTAIASGSSLAKRIGSTFSAGENWINAATAGARGLRGRLKPQSLSDRDRLLTFELICPRRANLFRRLELGAIWDTEHGKQREPPVT